MRYFPNNAFTRFEIVFSHPVLSMQTGKLDGRTPDYFRQGTSARCDSGSSRRTKSDFLSVTPPKEDIGEETQ
jgi:hypothetical protein